MQVDTAATLVSRLMQHAPPEALPIAMQVMTFWALRQNHPDTMNALCDMLQAGLLRHKESGAAMQVSSWQCLSCQQLHAVTFCSMLSCIGC